MNKNQRGFSVVEALLLLVIIAIIGGVGIYVYQAANNTDKTLTSANSSNTNTPFKKKTSASAPTATTSTDSLSIKEWRVSMTLPSSIDDATYQLNGNKAWLSTKALDADAQCKTYYPAGQSYQSITKYASTDTVNILDKPNDGDNRMSASQATKVEPQSYKTVGDSVYYFSHGNGQPCVSQTATQTDDFGTAFSSIRAN